MEYHIAQKAPERSDMSGSWRRVCSQLKCKREDNGRIRHFAKEAEVKELDSPIAETVIHPRYSDAAFSNSVLAHKAVSWLLYLLWDGFRIWISRSVAVERILFSREPFPLGLTARVSS
jgi:hypothetical protein